MSISIGLNTYKQRNPASTDLYKLIEANYESFLTIYDDKYKNEYGYMRPFIEKIIYHYLDCGILENGFARVKCVNPECGTEYLVSFSCKTRCICPSCHSKRSVIISERIADEVIMPVNHRHWIFTIPKLLRAYFRRNRKLNGILFEAAIFAVKTYFAEELGIKEGKTGAIVYLQTFGKTANPHSHLHALITNGLFDKAGIFHEVEKINQDAVRDLFKNKLFEILLERDIITENTVTLLSSWYHSGFDVYYERKIDGNNKEAVEDILRYITRPPISSEKVIYDPVSNTVNYKGRTFTAHDFIAQLVSHIPNKGEQVIRFYGVYSHAYKGKTDNLTECEIAEVSEKRKKNKYWARLIQKIFFIDPLVCSKCKSEMKIISFILEHQTVKKILEHCGLRSNHDPPVPKPPSELNNYDITYDDYIPSADDYISNHTYQDF